VASFVDVPGHERFVRNMLAGAHGLDAVLLVVAADESVMPQTREHFEICRLLGIARGLVVLTKCDLADADAQAVAESEVRDLLRGSFLEAAPLLRVSARTGAGLPELRQALASLAAQVGERRREGLLRLPVDRVFSLRGFGTVVTGTVVSGALAVGDELELLPAGRRTRARGLQTHGATVEGAVAGSRAAVNLAGLETGDVTRGDVLAHPGTLSTSSLLDVELSLLAEARPLEDGARVRVHLASAERLGRVRLLGAPEIAAGQSALAQIRLERPAVAGRGDRLVLRSYSPATTIGGARVLDPLPPKRRAADRPALERLRAAADPVAAAVAMVEEAGMRGVDGPTLAARLTVPLPSLAALLGSSRALVALGPDPTSYLSRSAMVALSSAVREEVARFHREHPLKAALPLEELRARVFARSPPAACDLVLEELVRAGEVLRQPDAVAASRHVVTLSPREEEARRRLLEAAEAAGLSGVELAAMASSTGMEQALLERVARVLLDGQILARVGEAFLVSRERLDRLKADVRARFPPGSRLDVAGFKELTGLSRKFAIPLLEFLDRERVTRRAGADRTVLG